MFWQYINIQAILRFPWDSEECIYTQCMISLYILWLIGIHIYIYIYILYGWEIAIIFSLILWTGTIEIHKILSLSPTHSQKLIISLHVFQ